MKEIDASHYRCIVAGLSLDLTDAVLSIRSESASEIVSCGKRLYRMRKPVKTFVVELETRSYSTASRVLQAIDHEVNRCVRLSRRGRPKPTDMPLYLEDTIGTFTFVWRRCQLSFGGRNRGADRWLFTPAFKSVMPIRVGGP